jgi:hypothetical protein
MGQAKIRKEEITALKSKTKAVANSTVDKFIGGRIIGGEEAVNSYFNDLSNRMSNEWNQLENQLSPVNMDLSIIAEPALDTTVVTASRKKVHLTVFTDPKFIDTVAGKSRPNTYLYQISMSKGSIILVLDKHPNRSKNWNDKVLPLTEAEQALTSWLLNCSDGRAPLFYPTDDIVKSVASKNRMSNVFSVLD